MSDLIVSNIKVIELFFTGYNFHALTLRFGAVLFSACDTITRVGPDYIHQPLMELPRLVTKIGHLKKE